MFTNVERSLRDLLGCAYAEALTDAAVHLMGMERAEAERLVSEKVSFFPESFHTKKQALLQSVGQKQIDPLHDSNPGAPTESYRAASNLNAAPLGGFGFIRVGEDGRFYLVGKSEHYHVPLGHNFPGYALLANARRLGVPNATHNNTRGMITRTLERQLIKDVNGIRDEQALEVLLKSKEPKTLNRVINLQTGSIAVEAGIKMLLSRFYRLDKTCSPSIHDGKTPVFLVIGDNDDGMEANYHGTTIIEQTLRGMWPELYSRIEAAGIYKVVPVRINDLSDFETKIKTYNQGNFRTAGFLHEIILMNYGGIRLTEEFLRGAYDLCARYETPTLADEIQSCMWYDGMFLFRLYGLKPDFVVLGKGFSGGEYAASKLITTLEMDTLNQFGALVTNGQEEIASLAYLITMEFVRENGAEISRMGMLLEAELKKLKSKYPILVTAIEGQGHLCAVQFKTIEQAKEFSHALNERCIDASAQTYKANCPPAVLLKPPVIMDEMYVALLIEQMDEVLEDMNTDPS